ncbi:MAG: histidinol dehydrogenase [Planctomycetes bacterium]|nr:histidinol dehydrogenase [Planctomycetota bacterium]
MDVSVASSAARVVDDVRLRGEPAFKEHAQRVGDWRADEQLVYDRNAIEEAAQKVDDRDLALLRRTADRLRTFASAQRRAITDMSLVFPGGRAGHTVEPVERAGCYVAAGPVPLPSAVLMTVVTARAAGVRDVWLATARPAPIVFAAAHVAGVDSLLAVGGAPAIAALAHGAGGIPACDAIVGVGDRSITAAKQCVAGRIAIDLLDGPNELLIVADETADARFVAADLLAQAEHQGGFPILVSLEAGLVERVERELESQLESLPRAAEIRRALEHGFAVVEPDLRRAIHVVDEIAPGHLQLMLRDSSLAAYLVRHCGTLFIGSHSAEAFGDYGAGPNYVLPIARGSRSRGGLSVFTFLRIRSWLDTTNASDLASDAARFARMEGLEAHARAAELRR